MTKEQIVTLISQRTHIEASHAMRVLEAFMAAVKQEVKSGKSVTLRGFGTFTRIYRKEKKGRNIAAGTQCTIPARNVVKFVTSKHFKVEQPF